MNNYYSFYFNFYNGTLSRDVKTSLIMKNALLLDLLITALFSYGIPASKLAQGSLDIRTIALLTSITIGFEAIMSSLVSIKTCFEIANTYYSKIICAMLLCSTFNIVFSLTLPVWWHLTTNIFFNTSLIICYDVITEQKLINLVSGKEYAYYNRIKRALTLWVAFSFTSLAVVLPIDFYQMVLIDGIMKLTTGITGLIIYRKSNDIINV